MPDLEPGWERLIQSLISRNPAERPRSATETALLVAELLGRSHAPSRTGGGSRAFFGSTLLCVGRDDELDRLGSLVREGAKRSAILLGEEGVGKTRLAEEVARAAELEGWTVCRSDAREGVGDGFRLLRRVRRQTRLLDLTGRDDVQSRKHAAPPRAEVERLVNRLIDDTGAASQRCLYVFDSLEGADVDSAAFLRALSRRLRDTDSFLLMVGRADPRPAPEPSDTAESDAEEIRLDPLPRDAVRHLLLAHLGAVTERDNGAAPPLDDLELDRLLHWLDRHAGGNPRRVESSLRALADRGALARGGATWTIAPGALESKPAAIGARERGGATRVLLPVESRPYLEAAAVCGAQFDSTLLQAVESHDPAAAAAFLTEAVLQGILTHVAGSPSRYRFLDPEACRGLYEGTDPETRAGIHRRVAELLAAEPDPPLAEIARHHAAAGDRTPACRAYTRAADANREVGALGEAARCYARAWELRPTGDSARFPEFVGNWVRTLFDNGQFRDAIDAADRTLAGLPEKEAAQPTVAHVLVTKATCLAEAGDRDAALRLLRSVLDGPAGRRDIRLRVQTLIQLGTFEAHDNEKDKAREHLLQARALAEQEGLPYEAGRAALQLGVLCWREDDPATALEWHDKAYAHLVEADGRDLLPSVWGNRAICQWDLLDARQAAVSHRRAADGYEEQHRRAEAARSYQNLAYVLTETGQWTEADRALTAAERLNRTIRGPRQESYFKFAQARLAMYRGRLDEALGHAEAAVELAGTVGDAFVSAGHRCLLGLVELEAGRLDECIRTSEQTLVLARKIDLKFAVAESLHLLGSASAAAGRPNQALQYLDDAFAAAEDAKQPAVRFRIQLQRAELLAARGDRVAAERCLKDCRALQERSESLLWKGLLHLAEGRVRAECGDHERACQVLAGAYEIFAGMGAERLRGETLLRQARSQVAVGSHHAARSSARHARSIYQSLGLDVPDTPFPEDTAEKGSSLHTVRRILETAASVSRDITTLQSVDEVLERILDVAITYLGTERGVVALADPETGELKVRFARNIDRESIGDTLEISRSTLTSAGREGEMVHTGDALADPQLGVHESVRRERIRSLISLPIRWGDEILGALYMDHRSLTDLFGREERLFLRFIADMAAIGIRNARQFEIKEEAVRNLRGELEDDELTFPGTVVGRGPALRELIRRGLRAARSGRVVLLTGPSGAGKDHFARVLHDASGRTGAFVDCPLPALPATLLEAELFGVERGAATLVEQREGLVETAHGGALFLNEIGDLPRALQPVLLHFIDKREYRRVGSSEQHSLDALILCATNADLESKVADGSFRQDLFFRLSECVLELPPLHERVEDIPDLADLILREVERRSGQARRVLHPLALDLLMRCPWEGNVRELRSCLSRAADETETGLIEAHHLDSPSLRKIRGGADGDPEEGGIRGEVHVVEIRRIHDAMNRAGGIITRAATILGLSEASLRRRISKYHLEYLVVRRKPRRRKSASAGTDE
ncbi:MAG TPA: sigma 54-interacting transcriptional regulator, partial [bacterium]|nr:sigma 54-interacting transcriptional regulator [bacterium]